MLATLLLLLYVFVSIPVQWLHYHEKADNAAKHAQESIIELQDSGIASEDCSICLHKYSSYSNDFFHPKIDNVEVEPAGTTGWIESLQLSQSPSFGNKGPPANS